MTHIHWSAQQQLAVIDAKLTAEFKEYAELANPKPLGLAATQELLKADEALVLILDVPHFGNLPEESLIWVVTKTESRWARSELGTGQLAERLRRLRSGLDNNADPKGSAGNALQRSAVLWALAARRGYTISCHSTWWSLMNSMSASSGTSPTSSGVNIFSSCLRAHSPPYRSTCL